MDRPATQAHYLSGTHWDREWYRPFEEFRVLLVGLIDGLIGLMERDPEFRHFHLDGQTCMLADYVAIRPERRERLARLIREGRILVGPWYTMPDLFCVGDEAILRNLEVGHATAQAWGAQAMPVGFVCDMFGHPSQMPQIFAAFGCHEAVLGRGVNEHDTPALFTWRSPDGSAVLAYKLQDSQGYGPMALPRACLGQHSFVQAALPAKFHADLAAAEPARRQQVREDWADRVLAGYLAHERGRGQEAVLAVFDSMDHTTPTEDVAAWLERISRIDPQLEARHSTLPAFFADARRAGGPWPVRSGELRAPSRERNGYNWLIPNCVSARVRLKLANDTCEALLCRWVEPLLALTGGDAAATALLDHAWRTLLLNQAHDSIGGCSIDQVHRDMTARFDQVRVLACTLRSQAVAALTTRIRELGRAPGESTLVLVNPLPWPRDGVVEFDLDLPPDFPSTYSESFFSPPIQGFVLEDAEGRAVPYQRLALEPRLNERSRLPRYSFQSDGPFVRHRLAARLALPPCGCLALRVRPSPIPDPALGCQPVRHRGSLLTGPCAASNGRLTVEVRSDGTLRLRDLRSGQDYQDLLLFEQAGEAGDGWFHVRPANDLLGWSRGAPCAIGVVHDGPEQVTFRLELHLAIPRRLDGPAQARAAETTILAITCLVTLRAGADHVEVACTVDHQAEDFRLRLLLPTDTSADTWLAHHPFDLVERPIALDPETAQWQEAEQAEKPFLHLQAVGDGRRGLAFVSAGGLHEGGVADDRRRTLHVTLLRSFRATIATAGEEDGLERGRTTWRFALLPFAGALPRQRALDLVAELQTGVTTRQSGARPSGFPPLPTAGESSLAGPELLDRRLAFSALRPAPKGHGLQLRLWNPDGVETSERVRFPRPIRAASLADPLGRPLATSAGLVVDGRTLTLRLCPHGIVNLLVQLEPEPAPVG